MSANAAIGVEMTQSAPSGDWAQTVSNSSTWTDFTTTCPSWNSIWTYIPTHYCYCNKESKVEKSYKIVRALMKAKVVKVSSLEKFFNLMDEVQKAL